MKYNRFLFLLLLFLVPQACTKEEADFRLPGFETPVVHGFYLRDEMGSQMGWLGYAEPNVKLATGNAHSAYSYIITLFPNPSHNFATLYIKTPSDHEHKKVWITEALFRSPFDPEFVPTFANHQFVAGGAPLLQGESTDSSIYMDLTGLPNGYYRIYLQVGGHLLYDNLVIDRAFYFY